MNQMRLNNAFNALAQKHMKEIYKMRKNNNHILFGPVVTVSLDLLYFINNLLSNAVKFTDQGSVTMTARYEDRRLVVALSLIHI